MVQMILPKTAVGLVGMFVFTAWLVGQVYTDRFPQLQLINDITTGAQENIAAAAEGVTASSGGFDIIGSIGAVGTVLFNLFVMLVAFVGSIFISSAMFVTALTDLPIQISEILITLISVGFIFTLISKLVDVS